MVHPSAAPRAIPAARTGPSPRSPARPASARATSRYVPDPPSDRSFHDFDDLVHFVIPQMRIDRQRENVPGLLLRDRKLTCPVTEIVVPSHQMDRPSVLHAAFETPRFDPRQGGV